MRVPTAVVVGVASLALAAWPASTQATPTDVTTTRTYLEAVRAWEQAVVASLPASAAAYERLAGSIDSECAGVLKGAPSSLSSGPGEPGANGRVRALRQHFRIEEEISLALEVAWLQPDRQALAAYAGAVMPLQWSSPALTEAVHAQVAEREAVAALPTPSVCADMKAWAASGYRVLPAGTKEYMDKAKSLERPTLAARSSVHSLLAPFEGGEQATIREIERLDRVARKALRKLLVGPFERLLVEVGLAARHKASLLAPGPAKGSVVIARGRTAAGERYVARLAPRSRAPAGGCPLPMSIEGARATRLSVGEDTCLSRRPRSPEPSVTCNAGRLTVTAQALPGVRSVRLRLSDGRQITSPVVFVPARLGGPAGYYYQVVRGPSPIPVSLTELGAGGAPVRVVRLPHIVECTRHPLKYLPGGVRTLVHETAPSGPTFSIVAERYRFLGHVYFDLEVHVEETSRPGVGVVSGGSSGNAITVGGPPPVFEPQIGTGCRPHPYAIVYGLLKAPGDTVLAGTTAALAPLRVVPIPASLHAGGALAYAVLPALPAELLVRAPDGRTVQREHFGRLLADNCPSEAEQREEEEEAEEE